ncbi:retrovirus-related pol polyprotein from transposon TNT 1-94 [Tanacetum coccineum]
MWNYFQGTWNDNQTGQFGITRAVIVVGGLGNTGRKPKRVKDSTYHKEKMLLCKHSEKGVQFQAEQSDWLDTDEEIDEQELGKHNLQLMQRFMELDVDENKKDSKAIKEAYASLTQELMECQSIFLREESNLVEYRVESNIDYDKLEHKLNEALRTIAQKEIDHKEEFSSKQQAAVRNTNVIKPGMYRIASSTTQTRAPQLNQTSRNTNPRVSTSTGVAHKTNVSRPQPRSNQMKDKVVPNTSHVKFKKTDVEEHPRISSISNQTKSVTACNDSLNSRTLNVNAVCATCGKCVFNSNHDACVSKFLKDVNARTKKPNVVPISTRKPKSQANKSVATPHKKTVASESTLTNSKSYYRMLYKKTNKAWKWWIAQQCPSAYTWVPKTKRKWVPKVRNESVSKNVSFSVDNVSRITNVLKLTNHLGFPICHVFHRPLILLQIVQLILFIVDSGCTKHMTGNLSLLCNFVEKYLGTVRFGNDQFAPILGYGDLVQGNITIKRVYYVEGLNHNLFSVGQFCDADLEVAFRKSTCFVRDSGGETNLLNRISKLINGYGIEEFLHLNFDYINLLSKKDVVIGLPKLKYVKDQLCSSCEVSKAKRSSFKSNTVPSSKRTDETPEVLKDFLTMIQRNLQAPVISVRTDRGTEFLNKTLNAFFKEEGIEHQTSTPRTLLNRNGSMQPPIAILKTDSIIIPLMRETRAILINIINVRKNPNSKHLPFFGCTCYLTRDGENLDKIKEKGDSCILVGYSTQSKGYRVYNKRNTLIVESIHLRFDEIKEMSETSVANDTSGLVPQRQTASDYDNPDPAPELQNVFPSADTTVPSQQELDLLFGPLYDEFFNDEPSSPTNVHAEENNDDQAEFTNPFCTPEEGIDFEESFAPVARLEAVRIFVAYAAHKTKHWYTNGTKPKTCNADLEVVNRRTKLISCKIGSLMYLTSSRPDIVQAVCYCARYQARPTEKHLKEVKRIFRYLRGTIHMGLWYPKGSGFDLTAFSDADHAGCVDTRKSTSGGIQFLEPEYVALSASCAQVMWMRTQLQDYGFNYNKIPLYCDSQSAIAISCNPVQHSRTKHIHTRFQYLVKRIGMRCLTPAELEICVRRSYALSWKPCQGDSLNLPNHRIHKDGDGDASFQLESNSLPHAHAQTTKTFYKHQDSRIMKAQELKTKTSAQTLILKITPQKSSFRGDC